MTCKDCIHYKVCEEIESIQRKKDFIWYKAESGCPYLQSGWISVEDRLPEGNEALIYSPSGMGYIDINFLRLGWEQLRTELIITHWMPLPEPPKEKGI